VRPAEVRGPDWAAYLATFHAERAGITEVVLEHARDSTVGTVYDSLVSALPAPAGPALDIACGSAPLRPRLRQCAGYLGVDRSRDELQLARSRTRGPLVEADARSLPVLAGRVDVVVSSMGLMLVER
jgi:ubiquinone/menaquinone biosynthesis C-methylase UbiE